jgi:hypothetical protein
MMDKGVLMGRVDSTETNPNEKFSNFNTKNRDQNSLIDSMLPFIMAARSWVDSSS